MILSWLWRLLDMLLADAIATTVASHSKTSLHNEWLLAGPCCFLIMLATLHACWMYASVSNSASDVLSRELPALGHCTWLVSLQCIDCLWIHIRLTSCAIACRTDRSFARGPRTGKASTGPAGGDANGRLNIMYLCPLAILLQLSFRALILPIQSGELCSKLLLQCYDLLRQHRTDGMQFVALPAKRYLQFCSMHNRLASTADSSSN